MTSNGHQSGRPLRAGDPRELDGYRIVGRLGRGGMGTVYLAKDASDRSVAVKLIHPDLADDESFRLRFAREVEAARRVARFSTAGVIDARLEGEPLFIVSEYVPGPNLHEAVRAGGPMSGGTLESLAMGVAAALTAIHGSGVIHRDLKPANVLLSPVGPKVIDFGIARALDDAGGAATRSSQILGTPSYMAPELILGRQATAAADIFAWGCLVAFAGTGSAPFDAPTVPAVLHNISSAPPRLDGLDPSLYDLVASTLDKDPENRPTSQQLLARLTGQEEPQEAEVRRTISTSWAPPSSAPVPGTPPQEAPTQQPPTGAQAPPAHAEQWAGSHGLPPSGPRQAAPQGGPADPGRWTPTHHAPSGGHVPPGRQAYGHPSPPQGRPAFASHSGPAGPGGPGGRGGPGQPSGRPDATPPKTGRRRMMVIGAAAGAVVLVAAGAVTALMNGGQAIPEKTVSIYGTDFNTDQGWVSNTFDAEGSDGYWAEQRGVMLQLDPETQRQPSRGETLQLERDELLPDSVLVSTTAYAVEGPEQATFGLRCWDTEGEDHRTQYEGLLRYDGQRAEIRRMSEAEGDITLAETTDVRGYEPYPLFEDSARPEGYDPNSPYDFDVEDVPLNTITMSCSFREDEDGTPSMELSLWVNGEHALTTVDEDPLPGGDVEDVEDSRRVGIVTRQGPGNDPIGVLFTRFSLHEILAEEG